MLIGLTDLVKKLTENRDISKITKHLIFPICFFYVKGRQFLNKFDELDLNFRVCLSFLVF